MPPYRRVPSRRAKVSRADATVPARFQLAADASRTRRQRACAAPAVRIANHESRITNHGRSGPPLCGGTPPQRPPHHRACASPADASAPAVSTPPGVRDSSSPPTRRGHDASVRARRPQFELRITNHESRITAIPALPCAGGLPPQRPPELHHRACASPACPRRARHVDATLRARFQLAADAPRTQCHHLGASPPNRAFDQPPPPPAVPDH